MGLRHRCGPQRDTVADPMPGDPQNFTAYAASSTVFVLGWVIDVGKPSPTDFDLFYSTDSDVGPWIGIPYDLGISYNHTGQDVTVRHWYKLLAKNGTSFSNAVYATAIAYRPVFTVAPPTHTSPSVGDTIQFTATDVDGGALTYSLAFKYRNDIFIDSLTGLVTVPATAAGTNGNITVRCTDSIGLYVETTCLLSVSSVSTVLPWSKVSAKGPLWLSGVEVADYDSPNLSYSTKWVPYIGRQADILMCYEAATTWSQFRNVGSQNPQQLRGAMKAVPHNVPIVVSLAMYPNAEPTAGTTPYGTLNTLGGNRRGGMMHI